MIGETDVANYSGLVTYPDTRTLSRTLSCKDLYQVNELEVVQRPAGLTTSTHGLA